MDQTPSPSHDIGELVRVSQSGSSASRRALVATVNTQTLPPPAATTSVDVVYVGPLFQLRKKAALPFAAQFGLCEDEFTVDEEPEVSVERLSMLLSFEAETEDMSAEGQSFSQCILGSLKGSQVDSEVGEACVLELVEVCKARVKQLCGQGDDEAAVEEVVFGLKNLCNFGVGSQVCKVALELDERQKCETAFLATVMTIDGDEVELLLESDEEVLAPTATLVPVPTTHKYLRAYAELMLKGVHSLLKQQRSTLKLAWRWASVVICLYELCEAEKSSHGGETDEMGLGVDKDMAFQARMYKARAHILMLKYYAASVDIRAAVLLKPKDKTARQMVKIIKQRKKLQQAENKKLVKEIARWVEKSLEESKRLDSDSAQT